MLSSADLPQLLGEVKLTKAQQYRTQAVLVGTGWKLRKSDKHKQYKEPCLLVSSLPNCFGYATKIAKCYGKRMQIEESFRDQKSQTYGLGSEAHRTYKRKRLEVLLLFGKLAALHDRAGGRTGRKALAVPGQQHQAPACVVI